MFPQHVFPDTAEVNAQGHLVLGGCDTLDLAQEHGTPVYVLDEATLRNRCRSFVQEFGQRYPNVQVLYASKAYINPALARMFNEEGLGLDVVSGGELAVARAADFPLEKVYFHGNNKAPEELAEAVRLVSTWPFHANPLQLAEAVVKIKSAQARIASALQAAEKAAEVAGVSR